MRNRKPALALALLHVLTACGGAGDATVGGTLSGLPTSATVTLQNNGGDNLVVSANGRYWFGSLLASGKAYAVTVLVQPVGASCSVSNASGTIDSVGNDITNADVACTATASVTGTVSGLASGTSVTLVNGSLSLAVASNGAFAFPGVLQPGAAYAVTVGVQPVGQICTVTNGTGTVVSGTATGIVVTCV